MRAGGHAAGAPAAAAPGAAAAGGARPDPPRPVDDLADQLAALSFRCFSPNFNWPYLCFATQYIGTVRYCVVDFYVHAQDESRYEVNISQDGTKLFLSSEVPAFFFASERLADELELDGRRDAVMAAHAEAVDLVMEDMGSGVIKSEKPQVVVLPFACDQELTRELIWNEGDDRLFHKLSAHADLAHAWHQMHCILRVSLKSAQKAKNRKWEGMKIAGGHRFSSPVGRTHGGGGGGGSGGGLGGGGGGLGHGGPGGMFGGGHGGGGLGGRTTPDSPMSAEGAYRSTGGPGGHVPTGLYGEAARRAARESARTEQENTSHESPRKSTSSKTAV